MQILIVCNAVCSLCVAGGSDRTSNIVALRPRPPEMACFKGHATGAAQLNFRMQSGVGSDPNLRCSVTAAARACHSRALVIEQTENIMMRPHDQSSQTARQSAQCKKKHGP